MSNVHSFEFSEMPLITVNGVDACLVNGMADIEYTRDGEWWISTVSVEGYQKLTAEERARGVRPWVYVTATPELADMISIRLEGLWHDRVQEAIREQLASDREDAADQRADYRRDARMGL
jgi:hypothetical protein